MPTNPKKLSQFWQELKRRKVVRVITVYAAAAFVILELLSIIIEPLNLPEWSMPFIIVLLCIGFIIAVILSWIYDITPDGIEKTGPFESDSRSKKGNNTSLQTWKIASYISFVIILTLIVLRIVHDNNPRDEEPFSTRSIAVLPFEDMSSQQDQEYFCDGIAEEIINSLTQLDSLKVISRTSSFAFKGKQKDIREIGEILGVSTVLEGSVQKAGDRLRITAQLINVEDGSHIWSEQYEREMEDIFRIEDDISQAIVDNLKINLWGKKNQAYSYRQTKNIEAYNLYLKGRYFWHRRTEEDLLKSLDYFTRAIEQDSSYALAYGGLADTYFIMTWWGYFTREEGFEKAKEYVYKALSLNDKLSDAFATLGGILTWYDWDWKGAEKELRKAISLNPNNANAYQYYSELMCILGKYKEAREYIEKAMELNPHSQIMYNLSAGYYYDEGAYEKVIEESWKSLEIAQFGWPKQKLFLCNTALGNDREATEYLKEIVSIDSSVDRPDMLDSILLNSGMEGILRWYINWLQTNNSPDFYYRVNFNVRIAGLYGFIGDTLLALEYLEKAFEANETSLPNIKFDPHFILLREDPRFKAMLKEMGL